MQGEEKRGRGMSGRLRGGAERERRKKREGKKINICFSATPKNNIFFN